MSPSGAAGWAARRRVRLGAAVVALVALAPALAACSKPVGSTSVRDVAWVTTGRLGHAAGHGRDADRPGHAARRQQKVPVGSLPVGVGLHGRTTTGCSW